MAYAIQHWYENLTGKRGLADNTAVRHFNVMHHMMEKASTIWSAETGLDRNPASLIEVRRPDDSRERYLSEDELQRLKIALDDRILRKGTNDLNQTNARMRLIVLIAVSTGMRSAEIHRLLWSDVLYSEGLLAVRAKLKGGKVRFVPMAPELAAEIKRYPAVINVDRIFPPKGGEKSKRQRLEGSFENLLERARIRDFRFHDLRHTFASWYMMNGGDLYELAKLMGHANIKMTERYAKLGRSHITKNWNHSQGDLEHDGQEASRAGKRRRSEHRLSECSHIVRATKTLTLWSPLSTLKCGGQRRDRTADAGLFRAALYH